MTGFKKLKELERKRKVTIGVKKDHANNFWYRQTIIGKLLNWLTYLLVIFTIITFVKFGILKGIIAICITGIYTIATQKIATMYVRIRLLKEENLFEAAYTVKSINIVNNPNNKVIIHPAKWEKEIESLA